MKDKIFSCVKSFLETKYFILLLMAISLLSYFNNFVYLPYYSIIITLILLFTFKAEFYSGVGIFTLLAASWQDNYLEFNSFKFIFFIILLVVCAGVFTLDIIRNYKVYVDRLKKNFLLFSILALFASELISLINTSSLSYSGLGIADFAAFFTFYFVMLIKVNYSDKMKENILFSLVCFALLVCIQAFYVFGKELATGKEVMDIINSRPSIGWCGVNTYIGILQIGFIAGLFLFVHYRNFIIRILICMVEPIIMVCSFMTLSRGGLLAYLFTIPLAIIYCSVVYIKQKNSRWYIDIVYIVATIFTLYILAIIFNSGEYITETLKVLFARGLDSSGRIDIYKLASKHFMSNWLIGTGVNSSQQLLLDVGNTAGTYHNHLLQSFSCLGIVGGSAFVVYVLASIQHSFKRDYFAIFTSIVIVYFIIHGCVDTVYFNAHLEPVLGVCLGVIPVSKENSIFMKASS